MSIRTVLESVLPDVDTDTLEYFEGIISENNNMDESSMNETLGPFLESYGIANNESSSRKICSQICTMLQSAGMNREANAKDDDPVMFDKAVNFSNMSKTLISDTEQAAIDSLWGFDKIRVKKNETFEVTEAGSAKYERKAKKEQKEWLEELESEFVGDEDDGLQISNMTLPDFDGNSKENDIHVHNFNITFGGKVLLQEADLRLIYGRRYGLVGRNGVGE